MNEWHVIKPPSHHMAEEGMQQLADTPASFLEQISLMLLSQVWKSSWDNYSKQLFRSWWHISANMCCANQSLNSNSHSKLSILINYIVIISLINLKFKFDPFDNRGQWHHRRSRWFLVVEIPQEQVEVH